MIILKYGNTNTYLFKTNNGYLLLDTDYAGSINKFYKAIKQHDIKVKDIEYILATHYHPDHSGLIGDLMDSGVKLLLVDTQKNYIHFSDYIFDRNKISHKIIDESKAKIISIRDSRSFLASIGIHGELLSTNSHSKDGIALILDDGNVFVGDILPYTISSNNDALKEDWENILKHNPKVAYFSHWPKIKF